MTLIVLGFTSTLLLTFALILAVTRSSPAEKALARRMASVRTLMLSGVDVDPEAAHLLKATKPGALSWLEEILDGYQFSQRLRLRIQQADSSTTVSMLLVSSLGLLLLGYIVAWFFAPILLVDIGGGLILGYLPSASLSFKRSRRLKAFDAVLAEAIDMLARALRAGYSIIGGIEMLAKNAQEPAAFEFGEIFKQQNLGLPMRDALMQLLDRVPSADLRVLVTAILVQKDTGGNLAEILDRTVFVIRDRLRIQGEISVQTAQGRLTGWILSALPVIMLVLINLVNPGYSAVLIHDPIGQKLIYLCIGMLIVGAMIIRKIVNGIEV
jgi:tight adherence protein B